MSLRRELNVRETAWQELKWDQNCRQSKFVALPLASAAFCKEVICFLASRGKLGTVWTALRLCSMFSTSTNFLGLQIHPVSLYSILFCGIILFLLTVALNFYVGFFSGLSKSGEGSPCRLYLFCTGTTSISLLCFEGLAESHLPLKWKTVADFKPGLAEQDA